MTTRHIAYGLELHASFPLPGMRPAANARLPMLALEKVTPGELLAGWSGLGNAVTWTGLLGDGRTLRVERGLQGDVLFKYGERARFRLDSTGRRLECAPAEAGLPWQQTLLSRILPNVAIMRGYEALHASAVESPHGVVALAGPSGVGKSTLAAELITRGWPLFADDVLILGYGNDGVCAHPGTPHTKVTEDDYARLRRDLPAEDLGALGDERWLSLHGGAPSPRHVRLICLLETSADGRECVVLPSTPLPLGPHMLGLPGEADREGRRFALYADLIERATLLRLRRGSTTRAGELADAIEEQLDVQSAALDQPFAFGGAR